MAFNGQGIIKLHNTALIYNIVVYNEKVIFKK